MRPIIISVAITGSVPRKAHNPAVPITPEEQIESTHAAFEAGAALVHIHVRNDDETPSSDPDRFARVREGVRRHCPGMIVQFSTGGRGRAPAERASPLPLRPDMASLSTGSVNFPSIVYENQPPLVTELAGTMQRYGVKPEIEIFDLSHLHGARRLADAGLMDERAHLQFVLGIQNALPAERHLLEILVTEGLRLFPQASWGAAGIGRHQQPVSAWAIELGGHVRTGLEDNIRISGERLAASNAELVEIAAGQIRAAGHEVATPAEARALLRLAA
ncbi:BKACE family enzyme [Geminicoccus harenae]|uniref:3-keto-5-aminohexanoate cleavage protein n=1 Tax=Geminicoccus harenae TaxID=2498453 RepID=UPI00168A8D4B|nr:3-keto-5-aminohexanoate cleavage protein [Geminicoccus harenae]